eukprot:1065469-Prorocentrum_minimum.AAC.1
MLRIAFKSSAAAFIAPNHCDRRTFVKNLAGGERPFVQFDAQMAGGRPTVLRRPGGDYVAHP